MTEGQERRCQGCEDAPIGQHTGPHDWEAMTEGAGLVDGPPARSPAPSANYRRVMPSDSGETAAALPRPKVSHRGRRNKGSRVEREVASMLGGKRTPLSGGAGGNDLSFEAGNIFGDSWGIEVKARANLPVLISAAMRQAEVALPLGSPRRPAVVLKADGEPHLFVARLEDVKVWVTALAETGRGSKVRELARQLQIIASELRSIG